MPACNNERAEKEEIEVEVDDCCLIFLLVTPSGDVEGGEWKEWQSRCRKCYAVWSVCR